MILPPRPDSSPRWPTCGEGRRIGPLVGHSPQGTRHVAMWATTGPIGWPLRDAFRFCDGTDRHGGAKRPLTAEMVNRTPDMQ